MTINPFDPLGLNTTPAAGDMSTSAAPRVGRHRLTPDELADIHARFAQLELDYQRTHVVPARPHRCPDPPPNHEAFWASIGLGAGFLLGVLATVLIVTWG